MCIVQLRLIALVTTNIYLNQGKLPVVMLLWFGIIPVQNMNKGYCYVIFILSLKEDLLSLRDLTKLKDDDAHTPLHLACIAGSEEVAKTLLEFNADTKIMDDEFHTPLHLATGDDSFSLLPSLCLCLSLFLFLSLSLPFFHYFSTQLQSFTYFVSRKDFSDNSKN